MSAVTRRAPNSTLKSRFPIRWESVAGRLAALFSALLIANSHAGDVVVSQIYGGGGNSGAVFRNDFVEVFNRSSNAVNLTGWTLQYASSASAIWQTAPLNGSLAPGQYFLLQLASGGPNGTSLPTPDATGSLNLAAPAGKVALVRTNTALIGTCPSSTDIVDLVGYGANTTCHEGIAPVDAPANATAAIRGSGGCLDTDENTFDFYIATPAPHNRSSPAQVCFVEAVPLALHDIQGTGPGSPFVGRFVTTTTNVITAVFEDGLFIQAPDAEADNDPATSEAIFVAIAPVIPGMAVVGNSVVVSGIVEESGPANPAASTRTQIINPTVTLVANDQPRPTAAVVSMPSAALPGVDPFERFEAMRVQVNSLTVAAPTEGFLFEADAQGVSDGVFYGVLTGTPRPMREPGISILEPLPPGTPPQVPRFDSNPERLRVDSNAQTGTPRIEVTAGATVSNLIGTFDFADDVWTILPEPGGSPVIAGNISATPVPQAGSNEFTVASFNVERFFDTEDDPEVDETVLTLVAFNRRLNKASLAIRNVLRSPDILGLIEVENLTTLQAIASKVNTDAVAAGQEHPGYAAWLEEGNDIGGIDVGFLVRTSRVAVLEVVQLGKTATYTNPLTSLPETLNDRPSLLLRATLPRPASATPLPVTVILNHLRSMSGIDDPTDGPRIRAKRRAQAEYLATLVQARQTASPAENLVLIGDFNAFPFNDGYVDILGTIQGTPTPSNLVTLASADLVQPDLINLVFSVPTEQRYSFNFDGNAQALDHILVNAALHPRVNRFLYARHNADFPESYRNFFNRPERVSDHDAPMTYFALTLPPRELRIQRLDANRYQLDWISEAGQTNRIERSQDLKTWVTTGTTVANQAGAASFIETGLLDSAFYRVVTP